MVDHKTLHYGQKIAVAFRGYNVTNAGKTVELLSHPHWGPKLSAKLAHASELVSAIVHRQEDLQENLLIGRHSTLDTYVQDLAIIIAAELIHWEALQETLGPACEKIDTLIGYSLGEMTALIVAGYLDFEDALKIILALAPDAAELARDVKMGIVFSRGQSLDVEQVRYRCEEISAEGNGVIAISTILSPNTVLLMGQGNTVQEFKKRMRDILPKPFQLRINPHHWPPLHTPIVLQKQIRDRAATMIQQTPIVQKEARYPVLSCVTGAYSYSPQTIRSILINWVDHPQQLWDCVLELLHRHVDMVFHLGPEPNIIPATLSRLADNVSGQLNRMNWYGYGLRQVSSLGVYRSWLVKRLMKDAALLQAPYITQHVWEDWLTQPMNITAEAMPVKEDLGTLEADN